MSPKDSRRLYFIWGVFVLGLVGVFARAIQLQVVEHEHLRNLSTEQYLSRVKVVARRGDIVDRKGQPLAITTDVPSVFANPGALSDVQATAQKLAGPLGMDVPHVVQRLHGGRYFVWLKRHVTEAVASQVHALALQGIGITYEPRRSYPNREVGAQVIGLAGVDGQGLEGIERQLDHALMGAPQMVQTLRDARGRGVITRGSDKDQRARGSDVELTLDLWIQHQAEKALQKAVDTTFAKGAMAVVLDVPTAEILAMAVVPTLDPEQARKRALYETANAWAQLRRNRAVTDLFEPGSTLKSLVVGAALDAGIAEPTTKLFCENGRYALRGHTISDTSPHGLMTLTEVLAKSSNIGMAKLSASLGGERLEGALRRFGIGERTGLGFVGEVAGTLRPSQSWSELEAATIAFGQGVAVTSIQLAAAYRVLAADGEYQEPRLVRQIRRSDGQILDMPEPRRRPVISVDAARRVTRMLEAAVLPKSGTGRMAAVAGYRVAGKTGTAQKADLNNGGYSKEQYLALFCGYLPAEAPRVVIIVAIDEPRTNHFGGKVAAPVFAEIGSLAMQRLGVVASAGEPQEPATADEAERAKAEPLAITSPVDDSVVLAPKQHMPGTLPSFLGLTGQQAVARFVAHEVTGALTLSGNGWVVRQEPPQHTPMAQDGGVHLTLAPNRPKVVAFAESFVGPMP